MPRITYNTKADFDSLYRVNVEPEGHPAGRGPVRLNYHRAAMLPYAQRHAGKLVELFAWPLTTRILLVGSGFSWTAEILEQQYGYVNIVTVDTSPYVQSSQDTSEEPEIDAALSAVGISPASPEGLLKKANLHTPGNRRRHSRPIQDESLANNGSRNRIRGILGDIQVGISEDVISSLDDSEVVTISDRVHQINAGINVIHVTTELLEETTQDPRLNLKTIEQWKALVPADQFVSVHDWQVV